MGTAVGGRRHAGHFDRTGSHHAVYAVFVTYRSLNKDYDAAVLSAGHCGFGMGASPNGIANMQALVNEYGPAPRAFFVLPLVSMLCDFANMFILTFFINFVG